jgi:hypothetical protein
VNRTLPSRVTVVWVGLMLATCATWWLGTGHPIAHQFARVAVVLTISIAFGKIYFIGLEFMELRAAPSGLRLAFTAWVLVIGLTAVAFASP